MTITGQVFKGYVEAIVARYGFGSNKMVNQSQNERRESIVFRGQRLIRDCKHAQEDCIGMTVEQFDKAIEGGKEGERMWAEMFAADKWLLENGYIREYRFSTHKTSTTGVLCNFRFYTKYGVTAKGWAVARKYLEAKD